MQSEQYQKLTRQLQHKLEAYGDVIALLAMGSMAGNTRKPDEWSDHDFFVITETGKQQAYRDSKMWLPQPERIVLHFQDTLHGCKALYDDAHLMEYAIFDTTELLEARIDDYQILFDKANISTKLTDLTVSTQTNDSAVMLSGILANMVVGIGRYGRGEQLSANTFIKQYAFNALVLLAWDVLPTTNPSARDLFDASRRFEQGYPELSQQLSTILLMPIPQASLALLDVIESKFAPELPNFPEQAITVIREYIIRLM